MSTHDHHITSHDHHITSHDHHMLLMVVIFVAELAKQMQKHILKRFFKQWHCMYLRCMYVHKQERGFPVSGPNLPLSQQVATLCSDSSTIQPAPDM